MVHLERLCPRLRRLRLRSGRSTCGSNRFCGFFKFSDFRFSKFQIFNFFEIRGFCILRSIFRLFDLAKNRFVGPKEVETRPARRGQALLEPSANGDHYTWSVIIFAKRPTPPSGARPQIFTYWPSKVGLFRLGTALPDTRGRGRAVSPTCGSARKISRHQLLFRSLIGGYDETPCVSPIRRKLNMCDV